MLKPLLLALWPLPALAGPLAGADDPAFRDLIARLLAADDRAAVAALHDLAATRPAALVALPVVQGWFLPADSRAARMALRKIGDDRVEALAATVHEASALWQGGAISPLSADQLARAMGLYALGETGKADALLEAWFNHMPDAAPLPEGFTDLPAAAWLKAMILEQHIARGDRKAVPVLQDWLDRDRIEGWMVLSAFGDHYSGAGQPMVSGLTLGPNTGARLRDGRAARQLLWHELPPPPLPPETVDMVMQDLLAGPEYAPVRSYCEAHCPGEVLACEAAYVGLFGQPYHAIIPATPFHDILPEAGFFASPRGEQVLLGAATQHRLTLDLLGGYRGAVADHPAFRSARAASACLAQGILRAQSPLPAGP